MLAWAVLDAQVLRDAEHAVDLSAGLVGPLHRPRRLTAVGPGSGSHHVALHTAHTNQHLKIHTAQVNRTGRRRDAPGR